VIVRCDQFLEDSMNAIRVLKHIDSDLVHAIPELRAMMGQDVEITIVPQAAPVAEEPLDTLETFLGDALNRPAAGDEEMAELRALAEHDPGVAAALWLSDRGGLDVDGILATRRAESSWQEVRLGRVLSKSGSGFVAPDQYVLRRAK
jgi:hypothetical protein